MPRAIRKYGADKFSVIPLYVYERHADALTAEAELIIQLDLLTEGYNSILSWDTAIRHKPQREGKTIVAPKPRGRPKRVRIQSFEPIHKAALQLGWKHRDGELWESPNGTLWRATAQYEPEFERV
jgi:hypothetical protein